MSSSCFEAGTPIHDQADDLSKGCEITWFIEKSDIRKPKSIKKIRNNNTNRFASDSRHCDVSNAILVMFNNDLWWNFASLRTLQNIAYYRININISSLLVMRWCCIVWWCLVRVRWLCDITLLEDITLWCYMTYMNNIPLPFPSQRPNTWSKREQLLLWSRTPANIIPCN